MKSPITFLTLLLFTSLAMGRPIKPWSYQRLFDTADLVVIAQPVSTKDMTQTEAHPRPPTDGLVPVRTELDVRCVMKGDRALKKCALFHFRFKNLKEIPVNYPGLVQFDPKKGEVFLFFLSKWGDHYEAVSGQMDPEIAVVRLDRGWFFTELRNR